MGWAVAPHAVREKLVLASEAAILSPSNVSQMAISTYLDHFDWQGQIKTFREQYRERRDAMIAALQEYIPSATWNVPDGGFYVWVKLPEGLDSKSMLPRAVTARVAYVPGHRVLLRTARAPTTCGCRSATPHPSGSGRACKRLATVVDAELETVRIFGAAASASNPPLSSPHPTWRDSHPERSFKEAAWTS